MVAQAASNLLDPNDGIALRTYYESLGGTLKSARSTWDGVWAQLSAFFDPYGTQWDTSQTNQGNRQDFNIINETGLLALRTLAAGMLTGMSPQTSPWFKIVPADDALKDQKQIKKYCEMVEEKVRTVFLKSNFYQSLLNLYSEEGLYGTSAFFMEEDAKTTIRCRALPVGSYCLGLDDTLRVDLCYRELQMTVRQVVERFGAENCSDALMAQYNSNAGGNREQPWPVVHVLHKGSYFDPKKMKPATPWVSVWYEKSSFNYQKGVLRRSGFWENPLICGRWRVKGDDVYGRSAGMDCLGSTMSLQAWEERLSLGAERQLNPTMLAGTDLDPRKASTLPGEILFADTKDVSKIFQPAYQVDFKFEGGLNQVQRIEARINDAMYRSLFQMFSDSDRREVTAEEIRAKQQEKMQVLGPVVERNVEEVLAPAVQRTIGILERNGMLPPPPAEMQGQKFKLEFISILAQAAKIRSITNMTQFLSIVGQEVAVDQGILDNVDLDKATRYLAEKSDVPSDIIRSEDEVKQIRADKQRAAAAAQAAEAAKNLAPAAGVMANTPADGNSLLNRVLPSIAPGLS